MRNRLLVARRHLKRAVIFYSVMCCVILFMPLSVGRVQAVPFAIGSCFWLSAIIGSVYMHKAAKLAKELAVKQGRWDELPARPGVLNFFIGFYGKLGDLLFVIMLALMIALGNTDFKYSYILYVICALVLAGFWMHCVFNGRTFLFLHENNKKRSKNDERE